MPVPKVAAKVDYDSVYTADVFTAHLRRNGWAPGQVPDGVIFTYGGFDMLCAAQPDLYTMNPMLGPGPGRFFLADSAGGAVGICCMGIGAPAVVAHLEVLVSLGVRRFLSLGTAGGLGPTQSPGDVVVLTGAVRDEGVSYHYVGPEVDALADVQLTDELAAALAHGGITFASGSSWTLDAPYRQTFEELNEYRQRGVLTVEMEASALFTVAAARGASLASAVVLDGIFGEPIAAPVMDTAVAFGRLQEVVLIGIDVLAAASA